MNCLQGRWGQVQVQSWLESFKQSLAATGRCWCCHQKLLRLALDMLQNGVSRCCLVPGPQKALFHVTYGLIAQSHRPKWLEPTSSFQFPCQWLVEVTHDVSSQLVFLWWISILFEYAQGFNLLPRSNLDNFLCEFFYSHPVLFLIMDKSSY